MKNDYQLGVQEYLNWHNQNCTKRKEFEVSEKNENDSEKAAMELGYSEMDGNGNITYYKATMDEEGELQWKINNNPTNEESSDNSDENSSQSRKEKSQEIPSFSYDD